MRARSRSFRFLVRLIERVPFMPLPDWRGNRTAPIDGRDVMAHLVAAVASSGVDGPLLHSPAGAYPEEWGILALHLVAAASFASLMAVLIGRWAIVPTWLFFVILGNASSGGAVSPALLPQPFAFLSGWLPSGATVTALRNAIYFRDDQHVRPLAALGAWATGLFILWLIVSRRRLVRETR